MTAMASLAFALHNSSILVMFSNEDICKLLEIIITMIRDKISDKKILGLAVWCLSLHQITSNEILEHYSNSILESLSGILSPPIGSYIQDEALNALEHHFSHVHTSIDQTHIWFDPVFELLFCQNITVRKHADTFLTWLLPFIVNKNHSLQVYILLYALSYLLAIYRRLYYAIEF